MDDRTVLGIPSHCRMISFHITELCLYADISGRWTYRQVGRVDGYGGTNGEGYHDRAVALVLRCRDSSGEDMNACGSWDGVEAEFLESTPQADGSIKARGVQFMNNQVQHGDRVAAVLCCIFLNIEARFIAQGVIEIVSGILADMLYYGVAVF